METREAIVRGNQILFAFGGLEVNQKDKDALHHLISIAERSMDKQAMAKLISSHAGTALYVAEAISEYLQGGE